MASILVHTHYIRENDLGTYGSFEWLRPMECSVESAFDFIILAASPSNSSNSWIRRPFFRFWRYSIARFRSSIWFPDEIPKQNTICHIFRKIGNTLLNKKYIDFGISAAKNSYHFVDILVSLGTRSLVLVFHNCSLLEICEAPKIDKKYVS